MHVTSVAVACAAVFILTAPAAAQWRYYDGYRAYPPDYSPYPAFPGGGPAYEPQPQPPGSYGYGAPDADGTPDSGAEPGYGSPQRTLDTPSEARGDPDSEAAGSPKTAQIVANPTSEPPGTIVVDTKTRHLFYVQKDGMAIEYGIGVGREGFAWKGIAYVGRKAEWPRWIPPKEMLKRRPDLPTQMDGGIANPLGARALYLFENNKDTLFRIHGTNEPDTIGKAVSSGCIRMMNADVMDLYQRVAVGTRVVVL
ncbi:MAG: L,D-transpeptidase [Methylovirgula sp.]